MVLLTEDLYIAKGAERECYTHPRDDSKLIKVEFENDRDQNNLDLYYYEYLGKRDISYEHISKCYGQIDTDKGKGVVFDAIKNYDGAFSKSFEQIIKDDIMPKTQQKDLLNTLQLYLSKNSIVFGDVVLSNILCQEIDKDRYKLVIVDGLGSRRFGFKLWMHIHSKLFTKYRIYKQRKKLLRNYEELY